MNSLYLRCPECRGVLSDSFVCANGHAFELRAGVLEMLPEKFAARLHEFTARFTQLRDRENRRLLDPQVYPQLPDAPVLSKDPEWQQRVYDWSIVRGLLSGKSDLSILDVGAWNGWLSNRLAELGHRVLAIDYFADEFDGLAARRHYATDWMAIQMDLEDLSVLGGQFDLVILNRCVQFFEHPAAYAAHARERVAPGGAMILTGLAFFRDPGQKIRGVQQLRAHFRRSGFDFFKPVRGYLDMRDRQEMTAMGLRLRAYPQLLLHNLKSLLVPTAGQHYYGVWP